VSWLRFHFRRVWCGAVRRAYTAPQAATHFDATAATSSWQDQTKGYFDEDDLVDPTSGVNARMRVKAQIAAVKVCVSF
jgi:hypothetical protein